jgi:hypothetical protein
MEINDSDDPRKLPGDIAGPGGPFDRGGVLFDTRNAVLMDGVTVATVDNPSDGRRFIGLLLGGRVNRSAERADVLYLFDLDGAAGIITELHGVALRAGWAPDLVRICEERWAQMPEPPQ